MVRKNEMLEEIKKSVQSVYNNISEENIPNMRRKMSKLLQQIRTNMVLPYSTFPCAAWKSAATVYARNCRSTREKI